MIVALPDVKFAEPILWPAFFFQLAALVFAVFLMCMHISCSAQQDCVFTSESAGTGFHQGGMVAATRPQSRRHRPLRGKNVSDQGPKPSCLLFHGRTGVSLAEVDPEDGVQHSGRERFALVGDAL